MRHTRGIFLVIAFFSLSLTAFAEVSDPDWWKKAAEPYRGVTIRGVAESTTASQAIAEIAAKEFEELTGITVEFESALLDEMYNKALNDIQAGRGIYDFMYVEQDIINMYLTQGWLINISQMIEFNPEIVSKELDLDDFTSFIEHFKDADGNVYAIPFEAFLKTYVYRKDLFADPEIRQAFQEAYGWALAPPATWKQYEQIAEFFTRRSKMKGLDLYGHTAQAGSHISLAYEMSESIWPAWGIWNWGMNMETMRASSVNGGTLDSQRAKDALAWYVDMLRYAPSDVRTYTWDEVAAGIAAGRVAQGLSYAENTVWIATDENRSWVTGKIGVALPPVFDQQVRDDINAGKGYIGYYDGAAFGIPVSAQNKEAAWLFLQFVVRKEWASEFAVRAGRVVRTSTFNSEQLKAIDPKVDGYYTLLQENGSLFSGAPAFPMHLELNEIQMKWLIRAVSGEITADEACDQMAQEIDNTLEELGY